METVAARPLAAPVGVLRRRDAAAAAVWTLTFALVAYLGIDGGGYDLVTRNQVGIVVWWAVLAGALLGVLPLARPSRSALVTVGLLSAFALWTGVATTSGHSTEQGLAELSRVACYLGVLVLAVALSRDRERALRAALSAVACAVTLVAVLALISRLRPGTFATAQQTAAFLPGTQGRLDWPLNYWNALAALMALGLPVLLGLAGSARTLLGQALAAAAVPAVALCGYLTFSRGGALAAAGGLVVYFVLTGERIPKLLSALVAAGGSAALVVGAIHRHAVENGSVGPLAQTQGRSLLVAVVLVCAGVGLAQVGLGLAARHGRALTVPRARARELLLVAVAVAIVAALVLRVPAHVSHAWQDFKRPSSVSLNQNAIGRFGAASGNGRYDYWRVAVKASGEHLLTGWGPGTFQFVWLARAPYWSYVRNAHSLYVETLLEDGLIGLVLIVGLFASGIGAAVRRAVRSVDDVRVGAAAVAAAGVAFAISAGVDWVWQVPVLPIAFLLLIAPVLAPAVDARVSAPARPGPGDARQTAARTRRWRLVALRAGLALLSVAALVAIAVPLAETSALRRSQSAAATGNVTEALAQATDAARVEPGAAGPQLQLALSDELGHDLPAALRAVRRATADEPMSWGAWLVRSRIEAESRHAADAVRSFARARSLNPHSPVFAATR